MPPACHSLPWRRCATSTVRRWHNERYGRNFTGGCPIRYHAEMRFPDRVTRRKVLLRTGVNRTEPICYRKLAPGRMLPSLPLLTKPPSGREVPSETRRKEYRVGEFTERKGIFLRVNSLDRYSLSRLIWITKQSKNRVYFFAYCHYPLLPQSRCARQLPPGGSLFRLAAKRINKVWAASFRRDRRPRLSAPILFNLSS